MTPALKMSTPPFHRMRVMSHVISATSKSSAARSKAMSGFSSIQMNSWCRMKSNSSTMR